MRDSYLEVAALIIRAMEEGLGLEPMPDTDGSQSIAAIAHLLRLYFIERETVLESKQKEMVQ